MFDVWDTCYLKTHHFIFAPVSFKNDNSLNFFLLLLLKPLYNILFFMYKISLFFLQTLDIKITSVERYKCMLKHKWPSQPSDCTEASFPPQGDSKFLNGCGSERKQPSKSQFLASSHVLSVCFTSQIALA